MTNSRCWAMIGIMRRSMAQFTCLPTYQLMITGARSWEIHLKRLQNSGLPSARLSMWDGTALIICQQRGLYIIALPLMFVAPH
jgi:hypothetical protein